MDCRQERVALAPVQPADAAGLPRASVEALERLASWVRQSEQFDQYQRDRVAELFRNEFIASQQ